MMSSRSLAHLISGDNLSFVWSEALLNSLKPGSNSQHSLLLSINGFDGGFPAEDMDIRAALNHCLGKKAFDSVETVADTIFPEPLYRLAKYDRHDLYKKFKRATPRFKALNKEKNGRGLYFERLTDFGSGPCDGNQLEFLIKQHAARKGVRASMFQATIFDPGRDHHNAAQSSFPCLQHISFIPFDGTLTINGFYATQQLFFKTYGNLLGLAQLGRFIASEMKLHLTAVNCFAGIEKLERITKTDLDLKELVQLIESKMPRVVA